MRIGRERTIGSRFFMVTATLLLRHHELEAFLTTIRQRGITKGTYLRQLVEDHTLLTFQDRQLVHDRARTCYQPSGGHYIRHNVKVAWQVWAALQAISRGLGISTCCLIAILASVDRAGRGGVPTSGRVLPRFNTLHFLRMTFEVRLTEPHFRRILEYERVPRNRRMAAFLMVRRLISRRRRK